MAEALVMEATLPLDHVVIAVRDLERAVQDYRALGFNVQAGGQHAPPRTSHNALVVFADGAYIELIAWRGEPVPMERWYSTLQAQGEGFVDFALLPPNTAHTLQAAQARGLNTLRGPFDGGRLRPDGQRVVWQTARHSTPDLPFLCGDVTPRRLRVPDDVATCTHPNGVTGVHTVTVAVHDLAASCSRYQALFGAATIPQAVRLDGTGLQACAWALQRVKVVLLSPLPVGDQTPDDAVTLAVRQQLATRGEGPMGIGLSGRSPDKLGLVI